MTIILYYRDGAKKCLETAPSLVTKISLRALAQANGAVFAICPAKYGCKQFVSPDWEGGV